MENIKTIVARLAKVKNDAKFKTLLNEEAAKLRTWARVELYIELLKKESERIEA